MAKNKQPIIGISMMVDEYDVVGNGVVNDYIRAEYGAAVKRAGGVPIFLDPSTDPHAAVRLCDGIVISGGLDIPPDFYGARRENDHQLGSRLRVEWERTLIDTCDRWSVPILGVCYGMQLLNVHYGGTLYQDIYDDIKTQINHTSKGTRDQHIVTFERDWLDYSAGESTAAAARHHQALKRLGKGLEVYATTSDGVIEAIAGNGHFGVQWHPESDETASRVYGAFLAHCMKPRTVSPTKLLRYVVRRSRVAR